MVASKNHILPYHMTGEKYPDATSFAAIGSIKHFCILRSTFNDVFKNANYPTALLELLVHYTNSKHKNALASHWENVEKIFWAC